MTTANQKFDPRSGEAYYHNRGYLPHLEKVGAQQFITFRLAGSLPSCKLLEWDEELRTLTFTEQEVAKQRRIEEYLDQGIGPVWLSDPDIASIVENAILYFDRKRYNLHAWVVMPNHVHVLLTAKDYTVSQIVQSWKSFTAKKANAILGKTGAFWQEEYFDRSIRRERHFEFTVDYIEYNPVKAGLCKEPKDWLWSSASR
ncbi:MAG: transposase [Candidatus Obscuribacterales bacterium]|nr:transposase [Candidatus Obscuribacterales bacterium]